MMCPCCSQKSYNDCCSVFHTQISAPNNVEELMRSRYTAFALGNIDYLLATSSKALLKTLSKKELQDWSASNQWQKLEVLKATKDQVEFKAYFQDATGKNQVHHERSTFIKEDNMWKYDAGIINPKPEQNSITRNAPCPCGSGKKYKRCCG